MGNTEGSTAGFHYGWVVAAGCTIIYFYGLGLTSNTISMFVEPLILALDLTKSQGSSLITVQYALGIGGLLIGGQYYKVHSARTGTLLCGLVIACGYFFLSIAKNLWLCYLAMSFIGFGYGGGVFVPASLILTRWFNRRRGMALGIAACGSGICTVIYPPLLEWLLGNYGLFYALLFQSCSVAVFTFAGFALLRDQPETMGLRPYGERPDDPTQPPSDPEGDAVRWAELLCDKRILLLCMSAVLSGMVTIPIISHLKLFYTGSGYSSAFAAGMVSFCGVFMLFGKPLFGEIVDRFGTRKANIYIYAVTALAVCAGLVMRYHPVFAYVCSVLMGLSSAFSPMATPLWAADVHGGEHYAQIYTYIRTSFTLGGTCSLILPGTIADITGSYTPVLWIYLFVCFGSYILLQVAYAMLPANS